MKCITFNEKAKANIPKEIKERICSYCNKEITEEESIFSVIYSDGTEVHLECGEDLLVNDKTI